MNRELLENAKEIEDKLESAKKVIDAIENKKYDSHDFSLMVGVWNHGVPFYLPKDMEDEILQVVKRYKQMYEKQLEEL